MKRKHHYNGYVSDKTDPVWAERVEREAERITDQTEARHIKASLRLEKARQKLAQAVANQAEEKRLKKLRAIVDERRRDLEQIERLMVKATRRRRKARHTTGD